MGTRYFTMTLDCGAPCRSYAEAIAAGMACRAIYPFIVIDTQTGEYITRFYSHRLGKLREEECNDSSFLAMAKSVCNEGVEPKFVHEFSDKPELPDGYIMDGLVDDFLDS